MTMRALLSALVLTGLTLPACAEAESQGNWTALKGEDPQPSADTETWREVDPAHLFIFETNKGRILIEAFPAVAPKHYQQFAAIIRSGDFDGTVFHRVIDGFMAQGGDIFALKGRESGLPDIPGEFTFRRDVAAMPLEAAIGPEDSAKHGYIGGFPILTQASFFAEMSADGLVESAIPHCQGVVSTARTSNPDSANSQFFLMRAHSPHLDRQYTAWGRVIAGQDVVLAIKTGPAEANGTVTNPDVLTSARIAADLPSGDRPRAWVLRTDTPQFAAALAHLGEPHICDLSGVPAIVEP